MYIFQSEQLNCDTDLKITSLVFKPPDLNPLDYHTWVRSWDAIHAKTNQQCRAEDCLAIDMEWFATGVHW